MTMAKKFKGSETEKNLLAAFAGESQARNRYTYFASAARAEGYEQIADIFLETAANEKEHAKVFFNHLQGGEAVITAGYPAGKIGKTKENLEAAAAGEKMEWTTIYADFAEIAKTEGFPEVARSFEQIAQGREVPRGPLPEADQKRHEQDGVREEEGGEVALQKLRLHLRGDQTPEDLPGLQASPVLSTRSWPRIIKVADPLPGFDFSRDGGKEGMGLRLVDGLQGVTAIGIADEELLQKVLPLVAELPAGYGDGELRAATADLRCVKTVAASLRFPTDPLQVGGDRPRGVRVASEADQLRVAPVPPGRPPQDRLRQERLAPEGDQPRPIQVSRMQAPETHYPKPGLPVPSLLSWFGRPLSLRDILHHFANIPHAHYFRYAVDLLVIPRHFEHGGCRRA